MSNKPVPVAIDPTLPTSELTIGGATYTLCLDLGALGEAEAKLRRDGHDVSLLASLGNFASLDCTLTIFAAALMRFHPEIEYQRARSLPNVVEVFKIRGLIADLWQKAMPDEEQKPGPKAE